MMDSACANCDTNFETKPGGRGYYRFGLDNKLPSLSVTAKEALQDWTSASFTPMKSRRSGNFLCAKCWALLSSAYRYKQSVTSFFGETSHSGYIGKKLPSDRLLQRHQPSTSYDKPSTSHDEANTIQDQTTTLGEQTSTQPSASPVRDYDRETAPRTSRKSLFDFKSRKKRVSAKFHTITSAISNRHYDRAIAGIYNATSGSKRKFMSFVQKQIRKEVKQLLDGNFSLCKKVTLLNLEDFSWDDTLAQIDKLSPLLSSVLKGLFCTKSSEQTFTRGKKKVVNMKPMIGTAVACFLYARAPRKASFLQTVNSIQMWKGGLKRQTIDQFSHMGVSLGYAGTLTAIDKVCSGFDDAALKCKSDLETTLSSEKEDVVKDSVNVDPQDVLTPLSTSKNIEQETGDVNDDDLDATLEFDHGDSDEDEDLFETDSEEEISMAQETCQTDDSDSYSDDASSEESQMAFDLDSPGTPKQTVLHPGFTLCWDNVGKKITTRHPTAETKNSYINFALSYMALNRVPSTHLECTQSNTISASDVPIDAFIPSHDDFHEVRQRMHCLVGRILTQHLPWFQDNFSDCTIQHLIHEHTMESTQRSVLVNLGVFEENPCTTQGAIGIYERFQKYIPEIDEKPHPTLVFGDGLSCERGASAVRARINGLDPWARLEGMQPACQEFHKEMLLLQDYYDEFFKGSTGSEKGTLFHLKNLCNFRSVKSDISDNFSHAWELMCQTTESFVSLLAMQQLDMSSRSERPVTAPQEIERKSIEDRKAFFKTVTANIVSALWHNINTDVLKVDATGQEDLTLYCCNEDIEEDFIGCDMRGNCIKGQWFHYSCAGVDPGNLPQSWYCSEECQGNNAAPYEYCYCSRNLGEVPMIGCSAETKCVHKEWYHYSCVGFTEESVPECDWFCSEECKKLKSKKKSSKKQKTEPLPRTDRKYLYSVAMAWRGLNLLCRRDAVREGDGDAMMSHWLIDMMQFYGKRHYKYVILGHRLLASINGWLPEKLQLDLKWNRTINYSGGIGRNLPSDIMNELLNRMFKDMLKDAHGHYTSKTLNRCSRIVGPLGEALDVVIDSNVMEKEVYRHRRRAANRDANVSLMIKMLKKENLFDIRPGRKHLSFPMFRHDETPRNAGTYLTKMRELSEKLDTREGLALDS